MEENQPKQPDQETLDEALKQAEELAQETVQEFTIGDMGMQLPPGVTPEMLQQMLAAEAAKQQSIRSQAYFTRKQVSKDVRRKKRKAQRRARITTIKKGAGRTISRKRRMKKAA